MQGQKPGIGRLLVGYRVGTYEILYPKPRLTDFCWRLRTYSTRRIELSAQQDPWPQVLDGGLDPERVQGFSLLSEAWDARQKKHHYLFPSFQPCLVSLFPSGCLNPLASVLWWECSFGPVGPWLLTHTLPSIGITESIRFSVKGATRKTPQDKKIRKELPFFAASQLRETWSPRSAKSPLGWHPAHWTPHLERFLVDGPAWDEKITSTVYFSLTRDLENLETYCWWKKSCTTWDI